jgi:hypothetical protein
MIMRKLTAFLILNVVLSTVHLYAQQSSIKGSVVDTTSKINLYNAVVTLLSAKDTSLVKFTRAATDGSFSIQNLATGKYVIMVTYPGYVEMIDTIRLVDNVPYDFNKVILNTKAYLLQEVIVRQTIAPIRFKGDTMVYMVDSFKVKEGATVEDLLKILPGISVNSKGEITTQGQQVKKVYVDGEEFFGDDPTMATKNLNSKDVAQVQLFDKKTDQATLTGIDDGEKEKAINLVLKEDAKKGYFGRVEGGSDLNKYYQGKATANRFTSTLKAGGYIGVDRTGNGNMTWEDMENFGGFTPVEENGETYFMLENDGFSSYNQQGIPESIQSAFMFNKKFGKLKNNTATNYGFNRQFLAGDNNTNSQYILPDSVYYFNQYSQNKSTRSKHSISTKNEFNLDSLTTITVNAKGSWMKSSSASLGTSEYLNEDKLRVNNSERSNTANGTTNMKMADIFLKRKLNKAGTRSFTVSTGVNMNDNENTGFLLNTINYYNNGVLDSTQNIDQLKTNINSTTTIKALASYMHPLGKKASLNLNYTFNTSTSEQDIRTFEKMNTGKYDSLNLQFSNHFRFISTSHRTGAVFTFNSKKIYFRAGLAIQDLGLKQTNLIKDSAYARKFTNFFPSSNFRWKFSQSGGFSISYSGSTQQPQLAQLQPILNNADPLNLTIGNQALKPAFNHSFSMNMNDFKVLSGVSKSFWGEFNFIENAFSSRTVVDNRGQRTTQTVNVSGNYDYYISTGYGRKIKFWALNLRFGPRVSGSRYKSFVNGLENTTNSFSVTPNFSISKSIEKKLDLYISYNPTFTRSTSSINKGVSTKYWTQSIYADFNYTINPGFIFNNLIEANFREKLSPTDRSTNAFIWNLNIEKKISKKKDIVVILSVNDVLNQRIGFRRSVNSNFITESTYTMVQRYTMIGLRWKFNKNKKVNDDE